jgi:DNA-directed RNA polymerase specialized sigma24 family protein
MVDHDVHLDAIRSGDADAFGLWVAAVEGTLRDTLRSFAAVVDTEAVLQESLLRVWQVCPRFQPDGKPNALFRLAVRVARNVAVSERRKLRSGELDGEDIEPSASPAAPSDPMLRARIRECHDKLPDKPRRALLARLEKGGTLPDEALAEGLSMRINTFLQNITRARKLLADCLEARGIDLARELG